MIRYPASKAFYFLVSILTFAFCLLTYPKLVSGQGVDCSLYDNNPVECTNNAPRCSWYPTCTRCRPTGTPINLACSSQSRVDLSDKYAFGDIQNLGQGFNRLVRPTFSIAATAVVFYFVYAGFKYITSKGDKESLAAANKMITQSLIGFIVLILSFVIIQFFLATLFNTTFLNIIGIP